jgi:serine/threonine protein kinase
MFIDEAKMVSGLAHPNIVQIHDLGRIDKSYYIAMEYVHGRDLRTILRRGRERGLRLPLDLSIHIVTKVCSALEYAHRKRDDRGQPLVIAHRDISPQNILISFEGDVKLTDFGIAKAAARATETDRGALRGKLLYMSPEQAWGRPMDRRSDLFSLSLVFYEMVTEHKPFQAGSEASILERVRECRIAAPSTLNSRVPPKLERVILKALERDPEMRYQDASEMGRDLDQVLLDRRPPSGADLARFLEILFDEEERADILPPGPSAVPRPEHDSGDMHIEFDAEGASAASAPPAPSALRDPMSIQTLLKRFGIK